MNKEFFEKLIEVTEEKICKKFNLDYTIYNTNIQINLLNNLVFIDDRSNFKKLSEFKDISEFKEYLLNNHIPEYIIEDIIFNIKSLTSKYIFNYKIIIPTEYGSEYDCLFNYLSQYLRYKRIYNISSTIYNTFSKETIEQTYPIIDYNDFLKYISSYSKNYETILSNSVIFLS